MRKYHNIYIIVSDLGAIKTWPPNIWLDTAKENLGVVIIVILVILLLTLFKIDK